MHGLVGHHVSTVPREGWAGLTNGRLLDRIDAHFDVFITMDRGMRYQQRVEGRSFGVIELHAPSNDIDDVLPLVPQLLQAISAIQPGVLACIDPADPGQEQASDTGGPGS